MSPKNCRAHQHCDTIMCWKCLRLTFSSYLEEAMFDTGKSLSTIKKLVLFLTKSTNLQGKLLFLIWYQFTVSVSSPLASINTNSTLLASASSPTIKVTETTTDINSKPGMKADATSGKEKLWKNFIYNVFLWKYASWYL